MRGKAWRQSWPGFPGRTLLALGAEEGQLGGCEQDGGWGSRLSLSGRSLKSQLWTWGSPAPSAPLCARSQDGAEQIDSMQKLAMGPHVCCHTQDGVEGKGSFQGDPGGGYMRPDGRNLELPSNAWMLRVGSLGEGAPRVSGLSVPQMRQRSLRRSGWGLLSQPQSSKVGTVDKGSRN